MRQIFDKKLPTTQSYVLFSNIAVKSLDSKVFDTTLGILFSRDIRPKINHHRTNPLVLNNDDQRS